MGTDGCASSCCRASVRSRRRTGSAALRRVRRAGRAAMSSASIGRSLFSESATQSARGVRGDRMSSSLCRSREKLRPRPRSGREALDSRGGAYAHPSRAFSPGALLSLAPGGPRVKGGRKEHQKARSFPGFPKPFEPLRLYINKKDVSYWKRFFSRLFLGQTIGEQRERTSRQTGAKKAERRRSLKAPPARGPLRVEEARDLSLARPAPGRKLPASRAGTPPLDGPA